MEFTFGLLEKFLQEHKDEYFADLGYIVSFPSVKSAAKPGAPFGPESARCLKACAELYGKYGFDNEVFDDLGFAMAYYGEKPVEGDLYTVVCPHTDVVPVTPEDWVIAKDPFKMVDIGENVVGRGVSDNKDAVISVLYILRAMKEYNYVPKHKIAVFLGSNEEAGMGDIRNFRDKYTPSPYVSIVPDSSFPVSFGERGSFHADVASAEDVHDILAIKGGSAYNVVLGKFNCTLRKLEGLEKFLEDNRKDWLTYEIKDETVEIEARGISAHGGRPYLGESALARFTSLMSGFEGFCHTDASIFREMAGMLSDVYGINLGIADNDPDMGKLTAANGKVFLKDGKIVFTLDIRFGPGVDKPACKKTLGDNLAARGFTLKTTEGGKSFKIDPENPLAKAIIESYRRSSGKADAKPFYMSGGTYSKPMMEKCLSFSVGCHCGNFTSRLGLPKGHGNCHEADETVGKEELIHGTAILGMMIADMDKAY